MAGPDRTLAQVWIIIVIIAITVIIVNVATVLAQDATIESSYFWLAGYANVRAFTILLPKYILVVLKPQLRTLPNDPISVVMSLIFLSFLPSHVLH